MAGRIVVPAALSASWTGSPEGGCPGPPASAGRGRAVNRGTRPGVGHGDLGGYDREGKRLARPRRRATGYACRRPLAGLARFPCIGRPTGHGAWRPGALIEIHLGKLRHFAPGGGLAAGAQSDELDDGDWLDIAVPGDVHRTLIAAGLIPDRFYDRNETACAWMEEREWWYRLRVQAPPDPPAPGERLRLTFHGRGGS